VKEGFAKLRNRCKLFVPAWRQQLVPQRKNPSLFVMPASSFLATDYFDRVNKEQLAIRQLTRFHFVLIYQGVEVCFGFGEINHVRHSSGQQQNLRCQQLDLHNCGKPANIGICRYFLDE
jgi:hypothetical protein